MVVGEHLGFFENAEDPELGPNPLVTFMWVSGQIVGNNLNVNFGFHLNVEEMTSLHPYYPAPEFPGITDPRNARS